MLRVGFGIAYSVPKAMRRPDTRDKQSGRFPRFFFIYPTTKTQHQWRSGNHRHHIRLRPTRIRVSYYG